MRLRLRVVPNAEREIRKASAWWHAHRPASPGLFRRELTRGFELITTQPGIGEEGLHGVRRLHLYRIRYYLYYRVKVEEVEVLALWHTSRGDEPSL